MTQAAALFTPCAAPEDVRRSPHYCRHVARGASSNFYRGMTLVPEPKRSATYALYAWLRAADDLADGEGSPQEKRHWLEQFWRTTQDVLAGSPLPEDQSGPSIWPAFRHTALRLDLPRLLLREHVEGQMMDQERVRYGSFEELYTYCYRVAGVVGKLCIEIWGYEGGPETRQLAEWRGVAFQLTNILRDVREDAQRGRVYLPAECFSDGPVEPEELLDGSRSRACARAMREVAETARRYFADSAALDRSVHRDGRACLWAMSEIYRQILSRVEREPERFLAEGPVRVGRATKLWIGVRALCR